VLVLESPVSTWTPDSIWKIAFRLLPRGSTPRKPRLDELEVIRFRLLRSAADEAAPSAFTLSKLTLSLPYMVTFPSASAAAAGAESAAAVASARSFLLILLHRKNNDNEDAVVPMRQEDQLRCGRASKAGARSRSRQCAAQAAHKRAHAHSEQQLSSHAGSTDRAK